MIIDRFCWRSLFTMVNVSAQVHPEVPEPTLGPGHSGLPAQPHHREKGFQWRVFNKKKLYIFMADQCSHNIFFLWHIVLNRFQTIYSQHSVYKQIF